MIGTEVTDINRFREARPAETPTAVAVAMAVSAAAGLARGGLCRDRARSRRPLPRQGSLTGASAAAGLAGGAPASRPS